MCEYQNRAVSTSRQDNQHKYVGKVLARASSVRNCMSFERSNASNTSVLTYNQLHRMIRMGKIIFEMFLL